jgi:hypothetical protein
MSKKSKLDQYYTKSTVAEHFSNLVKGRYGNSQSYVEPSAGSGEFSKHFEDIISFDIEPKFSDCIEQDFLAIKELPENLVYVGNPPFGFCSKLALKFINHCCKLKAKAVCFILPRTFSKKLFQNNINLNYHLVYEENLEKNSFTLHGSDYNVPCVFQIWGYCEEKRKKIEINEKKFFELVAKEKATHAIRRVGGQAGKVLSGLDYSESSTYFVKMTEEVADRVAEYYPLIKEEAGKTVGVRSITLKEITYILERY